MLITTSRKPSPKTRQLCKTFTRIFSCECINRGKMSLRDVFIQSSNRGYNHTLIIHEYKGNPQQFTFYGIKGEELIHLEINVKLPSDRLQFNPESLTFKCDVKDLCFLKEFLPLKAHYQDPESNYMWIKDTKKDYRAIIDFMDKKGHNCGFRIFIKKLERR